MGSPQFLYNSTEIRRSHMATTDAQLVAAIKRHSVPASFVVLDVGIGDCEPRMLLEGVLHYGEYVPCDDHST